MFDAAFVPAHISICAHTTTCGHEMLLSVKDGAQFVPLSDGSCGDGFHASVIPNHGESHKYLMP